MLKKSLKHANLKFLNYSVEKKETFLKFRLKRKNEISQAVPVNFNLSKKQDVSPVCTIRHSGELGHPVLWLVSLRIIWLAEIIIKLNLVPV